MSTLRLIRELLTNHGATFVELEHEPTLTSEQAAQARGVPLEIGGKALVIKTDTIFRLFVLSAASRLDSRAVRESLGARRTRFATPEELKRLTGLVPGSVPPFGRPILPFELYLDVSIENNDEIVFNAGSLTHSIRMSVADYLRIAKPEIIEFSKKTG